MEQEEAEQEKEEEDCSFERIVAYLESSSDPSTSARDEEVLNELLALQSIYDNALSLYPSRPSATTTDTSSTVGIRSPLRLLFRTELEAVDVQQCPLELILSIPHDYPTTSPPLIQLKNRYIAQYTVDDRLFGQVLRTFMHDATNAFEQGNVCLYEGIESVKEVCRSFLMEKAAEKTDENEIENESERMMSSEVGFAAAIQKVEITTSALERETIFDGHERDVKHDELRTSDRGGMAVVGRCPPIISTEAVVDRKSTFIGHAASVRSLADVQLVLSTLMADKKIARATHNISAYRFTDTNSEVRYQDNDDDGESAAGARLAHLLSLLEVDGVLVVVSRWYGGINLGADRFKHISHVARDALQLGGYLDEKAKKEDERKKKGGKKR